MPIDELQREVATVALRAAARHGFALAGGNALIAHGIVDRPTDDVNLFSNQEAGVTAATEVVETALRAAGFRADRQDSAGGLADVFYGHGRRDGRVDHHRARRAADHAAAGLLRPQPPAGDHGRRPGARPGGPGRLEGLRAGQPGRAADYIDTAAAMRRYPVDQLIGFAKRLDPGLEDRDFADAGRQLDRMPDGVFARYGLGPVDVARLRDTFADWPRP